MSPCWTDSRSIPRRLGPQRLATEFQQDALEPGGTLGLGFLASAGGVVSVAAAPSNRLRE